MSISPSKFLKLPYNRNDYSLRMRILPHPTHTLNYFYSLRYHTLPELGSGAHQCHRIWAGDGKWEGTCDYCALYNSLYKAGDNDRARAIKPYERHYYNVIAREHYEGNARHERIDGFRCRDDGPLVFAAGQQIQRIIQGYAVQSQKDGRPMPHITNHLDGRDFILVRTFKGSPIGYQYPDYQLSFFEDEPSEAATEEKWQGWLDQCTNLTTFDKKETAPVVQANIEVYMRPTAKPKKDRRPKYRSIDAPWEA